MLAQRPTYVNARSHIRESTLPKYEGTPKIKIKANRLSFEGFLSIVEKYGFRQMDNDAPEFKRVLRLA